MSLIEDMKIGTSVHSKYVGSRKSKTQNCINKRVNNLQETEPNDMDFNQISLKKRRVYTGFVV